MREQTKTPKTPSTRQNIPSILEADDDSLHTFEGTNGIHLKPSAIQVANEVDILRLAARKRSSGSFHSLPEFESSDVFSASSFLAPPPNPYDRELGFSSFDSNHNKRRIRRNSSSRLSDFEDDNQEVTLLSFAQSAQALYFRLCSRFQKLFHRLFFKPRLRAATIVCEADIVEQAGWLCKDYIINRLTVKDLMSLKTGLVSSHWSMSDHVIVAGQVLENMYPRTYSNLCRKLCVTMSSVKVVRIYLNSFLEILFEGHNITWAKIVSMFAVAGLFAEECTSQGHPDFVYVVVDTVQDFCSTYLLRWLVAEGGWESFPTAQDRDRSRLSKKVHKPDC